MRKSVLVFVGAAVAATGFASTAQARHHMRAKHAAMAAAPANSRADAMGQFYATPLQAGTVAGPGLAGLPGLDLAGGVVNGVAEPLLAPIGTAPLPDLGTLPGLDAAGNIVNGVTQPLLGPLS